ncbi:MAG: hypothetical protein QJR03_12310 [Sphaerobacter sp.]|nr:hypothetical protein [Sphaerobacter sp.]
MTLHRNHTPDSISHAPVQPRGRPATELPRSFTLTCADCGTTWTVGIHEIVMGDRWISCPRCTRPQHGQDDW